MAINLASTNTDRTLRIVEVMCSCSLQTYKLLVDVGVAKQIVKSSELHNILILTRGSVSRRVMIIV